MPSMGAEAEEESVYNLIPRPQVVLDRPPMHRSKFAETATVPTFSASAPVRAAATMGRPLGANGEDPRSWLRKHAKEPVLPDPHPPTSPKTKLKAPVPPRTEPPLMGLTSDKNWVVENAVEAITAKRGTGRLAHSGAVGTRGPQPPEIDFTQRRGFGKVPVYLRRNKAAIADEQQQIDTFLRLTQQPEGSYAAPRPMDPEERAALLSHLKAKWASVNAAYLKLGFVLDIESKIKRKEVLEQELAQIESDIKTLSRGEAVLVLPDDH